MKPDLVFHTHTNTTIKDINKDRYLLLPTIEGQGIIISTVYSTNIKMIIGFADSLPHKRERGDHIITFIISQQHMFMITIIINPLNTI